MITGSFSGGSVPPPRHTRLSFAVLIMTTLLSLAPALLRAQEHTPNEATIPTDTDTPAHLDIGGFMMLDSGYNFNQIHPDWYDTMRPTKLPSFKDEFGKDGSWFMGVRQSRLGFKG